MSRFGTPCTCCTRGRTNQAPKPTAATTAAAIHSVAAGSRVIRRPIRGTTATMTKLEHDRRDHQRGELLHVAPQVVEVAVTAQHDVGEAEHEAGDQPGRARARAGRDRPALAGPGRDPDDREQQREPDQCHQSVDARGLQHAEQEADDRARPRARRNDRRSARIHTAVKSNTCIGISENESRENETSGSRNANPTSAASATNGLRKSRQAATKNASSATPPSNGVAANMRRSPPRSCASASSAGRRCANWKLRTPELLGYIANEPNETLAWCAKGPTAATTRQVAVERDPAPRIRVRARRRG